MPWPVGPVDPRTKLDALAPPDDSTKLDASTKRHGLMPKLTGNPAQVLTGAGTFATPGSGAPLNVTDSTFNILDDVTPSKIAQFQCALITPATTRIYSFPDVSSTLAVLGLAQTFTQPQTFPGGGIIIQNAGGLIYFNTSGSGNSAFLNVPEGDGSLACYDRAQTWTTFTQTFTTGSILINSTKFTIQDPTDTTKSATFVCSTIGTGTGRLFTFPNASGTLMLTSDLDVARTWTTLQKFKDSTFLVGDDADITKALVFSLGGATAGKTMTLLSSHTLDRTLTLPNVTGTLATLENAQTFSALQTFDGTGSGVANAPISILGSAGAGTYGDGTSVLRISDTITGFAMEIQLPTTGLTANRLLFFPDGAGQIVLATATQSLNNKTLTVTGNLLKSTTAASGVAFSDNTTASKQLRMILSGATGNNSFTISSTAARNYTFPDAAIVVAGSAAALTSGKIPVAGAGGILADMVASSAYTPTNVTTDRSYDANATTLDEVADVLGTLIADLQAKGILG